MIIYWELLKMASASIDFNKVNNQKYQLYRIMQTSAKCGEIYKRRIKILSRYRTSIIFPESLLGLNQNAVYYVRFECREALNMTISRVSVDSFKFTSDQDEPYTVELKNIDVIKQCENRSMDLTFSLSGFGRSHHYDELGAMFAGKKDAARYSCDAIEKAIDSRL